MSFLSVAKKTLAVSAFLVSPNAVSLLGTPVPGSQQAVNSSDTKVNGSSVLGKHEFLQNCDAFALLPDEYVMFSNGTAYVEAYNKTYNSSFYFLEGDILKVCAPTWSDTGEEEDDPDWKFSRGFMYVTSIGLALSILCLILHLIAFCVIPSLRNLPGYNLASLCLSLLFGYIFFILSHAQVVQDSKTSCVFIAAVSQFFLTASFMWMSTMAFDVFRSLLKATGKLRLATKRFSHIRFTLYCLYSWGTPFVLVAATIALDHIEGLPKKYRPLLGDDICWFNQKLPLAILFVAPLSFIMLTNVIFFGMSAYVIFANRMKTEESEYRNVLKRNCIMYFRLCIIMGLTWVIGVLSIAVNETWLWYIYVLFNTLQGFFIFLGFTCTAKVKTYIKERLKMRARKISTVSSTPTFQSYWNSGFSDDDISDAEREDYEDKTA